MKDILAAAPAFSVKILPLALRGPDHIDRIFAAMENERAGALVILAGPVIGSRLRQMADLALRGRLPAIFTTARFPGFGGLMS